MCLLFVIIRKNKNKNRKFAFMLPVCESVQNKYNMKRTYVIKRAGADDMPLIHDMAEIVFRDTYKDILSPEQMEYMMDWMYSIPNLLRQLDEGHVYYIALTENVPCGYLSVQPDGVSEDGRMLFHLQKLYVLPSEQGFGLGKKLFEQAIDHVSEVTDRKSSRIELNVNRNNPSLDFYKHLGMKILREGDFHIGNGFYMNDYIMGLDI